MEILCEGCGAVYHVRGKLDSSSRVETGGYQNRPDEHTKQFLRGNLNKAIEYNQQQLLNGDLSSVRFEPNLKSWRCPKCGYAQSWMIKLFHSGGKITCLTIAASMAIAFIGMLVAFTLFKANGTVAYYFVGAMLVPVSLVLILEFFCPWVIVHPNRDWFKAHVKKPKDAPPGHKPLKVMFD